MRSVEAAAAQWRRHFCTAKSPVKIFDRQLKQKQRDRAAWLMKSNDTFVDSVAENVIDRLQDCTRSFPTALCMGGSLEAIRRLLNGRGGIEKLTMMDMSLDMIRKCRAAEQNLPATTVETSYVIADEEYLPLKESCLGLHWTNDLLGAMIQSRMALKPDGLFLGAILGGQTLKELRIACTVSHMEREGGISPRLSPLAQVGDAGNLLTRAGFSLPGVDVDEYIVKYKSALELIEHLRSMGEGNALSQTNRVLDILYTIFLDITDIFLLFPRGVFYFEPTLKKRNSTCCCSHIRVNVCRGRWHCSCNIPVIMIRPMPYPKFLSGVNSGKLKEETHPPEDMSKASIHLFSVLMALKIEF